MESIDTVKRVTRSQLPLPDSHLSLNRSPLKEARIAQRNQSQPPPEVSPDDGGDTDDEILLSPGKNRQFNAQVNANSKRSASPPPTDEYNNTDAPLDGRELKRLKWDAEEMEKHQKQRDLDLGGSDIENTDTNIRTTTTPSHTRNLSEPIVASNKKSSKSRSASKQTPASPKNKGRARSVPVYPVLDLSNPPVTPWHRRARSRSRSPSKERDSPKLQLTFSALASIPDEGPMPPPPPPAEPTLSEPPAAFIITPPMIVEPPCTPAAPANRRTVFATPMSPLTPLPETPRQFPSRQGDFDGFPRAIGWGVSIADVQRIDGLPPSSESSSLFPPIPNAAQSLPSPSDDAIAVESPAPADTPLEATQLRETAEASKPAKASSQSRLPRPSTVQSSMGPPPVPVASTSNLATVTGKTSSKAKSMGPPSVPSTGPQNAFSLMMASKSRGVATRAQAKGKEKEIPKPVKSIAASSSTSTSLPKVTTASSVASSSKSAVTSSSKAPAAAPKENGKGKGKEKEQPLAKAKEETKKSSLKSKMRPREKPKPLPLPMHIRDPDDSDGELTSTPTTVSRPETPISTTVAALSEVKLEPVVPAAQYERRVSSPLSELDDDDVPQEAVPTVLVAPPRRLSSPLTDLADDDLLPEAERVMEDDALLPPASSSPDMFPSPAAGPQLELPTEAANGVSASTLTAGETKLNVDPSVDMSGVIIAPIPTRDVIMDSVDGVQLADVSMPEALPNVTSPADLKGKIKSSGAKAKPRGLTALPPAPERVTRSALKRKEAEGGAQTQTQQKLSFGVGPAMKKQKMNADYDGSTVPPSKIPLPSPSKKASFRLPEEPVAGPSSPSKRSSFADPTKSSATRASLTKTPGKNKPVSAAAGLSGGSESPTKNKLARSSSLFTAKPPSYSRIAASTSSLLTLANALEKLKMPPPERPNTSMGFSKDDSDKTLAESTRSADDRSIGLGRPTAGLQRASTVASIESTSSTSSITGGTAKATSSVAPAPLKQGTLTAFMGGKGATAKLMVGSGSILRGTGSAAAARGGLPSVFGTGRGRSAPKVSRNPGLPSVMASPVKGGGGSGDNEVGDDTMLEEELMPTVAESFEPKENALTIERVTSPRGVSFDLPILAQFEASKKGKEKERLPEEWRQNASRRASMALQDLSKSVSLPVKPVMGPPENPLQGMRSTSSSYPSSSSADPTGSSNTDGMRRSTRIAKATAETSIDNEDVSVSEPTPTIQPLTVLKGCIVFVDIISDVGDHSARSFITDMLKNLGARVLGSVGQTCTHIVYKNGLRSTYNRYKALADPKPHVVGMEWVVQSAEKRSHEDETPYLIDMDDMNTTAIKRRKSMLPRLMSGSMADDSMDGEFSFEGSSSSMIMDDELSHLAPLERARLRKAGAAGI
ncbi:BRCT domain-containing protein [Favolaschia claudopus]|uniref:BRCT domain-containing protein n=1 Tax=Favolaschia claudopus TaxID=2862362 RepID=A0AAW0E124_9AGAR